MKKKFLSVILALSMLFAFMPVIAVAETSGSCGDNVTWVLDDSGTLTISGEGGMNNYNNRYNYSPFYENSNIKSVVIENGVTTIGERAFYGCSGLTSVTIASGLTSIGSWAFYGCTGLTSVTIPDSVTSIGNSTFYNCTGLLSAIIGNSVASIDESAFSSCKNLKKIYIPKSLTEIEQSAFANCSALTAVEYGGSEADWNEIYMGSGNDNLTNATIHYNSTPDNIKLTDSDYLTYTVNDDNTITIISCYENATNINIPAEIDGLPVTTINASAFANRTKLTSVTIPDSVTAIGERAFYGCGDLTDIVIPDGVTTIENSTFYNCVKLEKITIPDSVTVIGNYAFYGCDSLAEVYYSGSEEQWKAVSIGYSNSALTSADIYYSGTVPTPTPSPTPAPTPIPITTAEITKSETETTYNFDVSPKAAYENCYVYAAVYDDSGVLLAVNRVPLETTGDTIVSVNKSANDALVKVFIWADTLQPIVLANEFSPAN